MPGIIRGAARLVPAERRLIRGIPERRRSLAYLHNLARARRASQGRPRINNAAPRTWTGKGKLRGRGWWALAEASEGVFGVFKMFRCLSGGWGRLC